MGREGIFLQRTSTAFLACIAFWAFPLTPAFGGTVGCCKPDGSCILLTSCGACFADGGASCSFTSCSSITCPVTGACCNVEVDATTAGATPASIPGCVNTDSSECATLGGDYKGDGTLCTVETCPTGACCFSIKGISLCVDGVIQFLAESLPVNSTTCPQQPGGGTYLGDGTACTDSDNVTCPAGACCLESGVCEESVDLKGAILPFTEDLCDVAGGTFQGPGTTCDPAVAGVDPACEVAACCFDDGSCSEITVSACFGQGGTPQSPGSSCKSTECPLVPGACCFDPPFPFSLVLGSDCDDDVLSEDCEEMFETFHPGQTCDEIECGGPPTGACCVGNNHFQVAGFEDGCVEVTEERCSGGKGLGGEYQGDGTTCDSGICVRRLSVSEKGSLLSFSALEVGFSPAATTAGPGFALSKDTFITLVNDLNREVCVEWHFINGDDPLPAIPGIERAHPGWNSYDCVTCLTPHENVFMSMSRGGGSLGCQPLTGLDPGTPPGRPDPDGLPGDRIVRGFAIAFAVDRDGNPISWNHLSGHVDVVDYRNRSAWEYNTYAFQCVADPVAGNPCGVDPTTLSLDGVEYALAWDRLLFDFYAVSSTAFGRLTPAVPVTLNTELTLYPVSVDLRPNSTNTSGPVLTRADIVIWNENEDDRTGTSRCINCWDQTLLSNYDAPNNFLIELLNTNKGYARINGVKSDSCDAPGSCCCRRQCSITAADCENSSDCPPFGAGIPQQCGLFNCFDPDCTQADFIRGTPDRDCSEDAALLGLSDKILTFGGAAPRRTDAGMTLVAIGTQAAVIRRNVIPPTAPLKEEKRALQEGPR